MIDKNKQYTLDGEEFKIYEIYPDKVHGAYKTLGDTWRIQSVNHSDLIEVSPYANIRIDDKVLVWDGFQSENGNKTKAHFAGLDKEGNPMSWVHGMTSFTTSELVYWNFCEPYTETEPNK
jgi:hypothetical protein